MASSMPFGLSYNEAANPRAAPLQAWITAAATTGIWQYSPSFSHNCQTPAYVTNRIIIKIMRFKIVVFNIERIRLK